MGDFCGKRKYCSDACKQKAYRAKNNKQKTS